MKFIFILTIATTAILLARPATADARSDRPSALPYAPRSSSSRRWHSPRQGRRNANSARPIRPSTLLDDPSCNRAAAAYTKALSRVLTPAWWSAGAETLEACRVHGKPGALSGDEVESLDEGPGEEVQGDDRVRLLVLGNVCGTAGFSNVMLVVRTDRGPVATPLFFAYNQGGQEAPFSLDIVHEGAATYALFTAYSHDMNDAFTGSLTYQVDTATGAATLYPSTRRAPATAASFGTSEPIGGDSEETGTAQIQEGRFAKHFVRSVPNACADGDKHSMPTRKESYSWNGTQFVADDYDAAHRDYLRRLAVQRDCLARKFDAKKGVAICTVDFPCEGNNDLSLLAYKAALFNRAKQYAADALQECRGRAELTASATFNYLRASKSMR